MHEWIPLCHAGFTPQMDNVSVDPDIVSPHVHLPWDLGVASLTDDKGQPPAKVAIHTQLALQQPGR